MSEVIPVLFGNDQMSDMELLEYDLMKATHSLEDVLDNPSQLLAFYKQPRQDGGTATIQAATKELRTLLDKIDSKAAAWHHQFDRRGKRPW